MDRVTLLLGALELFSDLSNLLLLTTVAAIGWVIHNREKFSRLILLRVCLISLSVSVLFAVFTLALVPQVAEQLNPNTLSIYSVEPRFCLLFGEAMCMGGVRFAYVMWPQHVLFLTGLGTLVWGTLERRMRPRTGAAAVHPEAAAAGATPHEPPARPKFDPTA